jgi:hypothetical protein
MTETYIKIVDAKDVLYTIETQTCDPTVKVSAMTTITDRQHLRYVPKESVIIVFEKERI